MASIGNVVVPAFPFEGALFWFLSGDDSGNRHSMTHPYYRVIYGPEGAQIAARAASLSCLFDEVTLAPADMRLPDYKTRTSGDSYNHSDLQVSMNWRDAERSDEDANLAELALQSDALRELLGQMEPFKGDGDAQKLFVSRTLLQSRVASKRGAVLLGNSFFHRVHHQITAALGERLPQQGAGESTVVRMEEKLLTVVGLDFAPTNVEAFARIRQTTEVTEYAGSWREAIEQAQAGGDLQSSLLNLLRESMEKERIANLVANGFQSVGSIANLAGLIPVVGTVSTGAGIGADALARVAAAKQKKHQWYLLGPKMRELALRDLLSNEGR